MSDMAYVNNDLIAIVSHDAGGAEILCNWAVRQSAPYILVLDGPAKKIFERKLGPIETVSLEHAIEKASWVLTGTSWQSDLEVQAIKLARKLNKKSVSFLDHWVNYQQRFEFEGKRLLPDEIWVGDKDAQAIAREELPEVDVCLKTNPYFEDIISQFEKLKQEPAISTAPKYILYTCSALSKHAKVKYGDERYWGFNDHEAVRFFLENVAILNHPTGKVVLRPHPSDEPGKYDWAVKEFQPNVSISSNASLIEDIAGADIIAGHNSMAMVIGLLAGKRIINALPPGKLANMLPMAGIEHMNDLLEAQSE